MQYPSPPLSFNLLFFFFIFFLSFSHNFPCAMPDQGHHILLNLFRTDRQAHEEGSYNNLSLISWLFELHIIGLFLCTRQRVVLRLIHRQIHRHYSLAFKVTYSRSMPCATQILKSLGCSWQQLQQWKTVALQCFWYSLPHYFLFLPHSIPQIPLYFGHILNQSDTGRHFSSIRRKTLSYSILILNIQLFFRHRFNKLKWKHLHNDEPYRPWWKQT